MLLVAMFSSFTSGGGIGGNKEIGDPPLPWVGCLLILIVAVVMIVVVT
jgi:hypothetical protein